MSEFKDKTYKLVGESFFLSYVLKTGKNKKLTIFDDSHKDSKKHAMRAIRYCPNERSIFLDEQSEHAVVAPIIFQNGLLEVPATNKVLQEFLAVHPSNKANGGRIFEELNPEVQAKAELNKVEMILDIKAAVRAKEKEADGLYELEALASVLAGSIQAVKGKTVSELKQIIYDAVDANPNRFVDESGNVTIFDDSFITRKYIVLKAIHSGVIGVSGNNSSIIWGDTKSVIVNIPKGKSPVDFFTEYLETDEGLALVAEISKRG